jgi:hypothetical protein
LYSMGYDVIGTLAPRHIGHSIWRFGDTRSFTLL